MAKQATNSSSSNSKSKKTTEKKSQKLDYNQFVVEVQKRAYEKYQDRINKQKPGDTLSDWLSAEKELKKRYTF